VSELQNINWQSLLKAAQEGDQNRQKQLIEVLTVRLRVIIQYRCWGWSSQDQQDILQETLEVFWSKLNSISDNPETYALRILRNKIGDELRKKLGRRNISSNEEEDQHAPPMSELDELVLSDESCDIEGNIEQEELIERFKYAIKRLPNLCKTLFMGLLEGKNINDLWEFFSSLDPKLTRSAFDTRNSRCRQKLVVELKKLSLWERGN
jgi:RNA polymerase sigma factor (sigma-70 family)